jgi:O-antigen/teichoic acid export membrane protein
MSAAKNNFQGKTASAAKWSAITEIAAKIVTPVTTMVLARILAPEAFGVVATVTMIVSFADMFTDAGFQKYLVQYEFKDDVEKYKNTNVAFWTNLAISFFLWAIIAIFCEPIAALVGNQGLGNVIVIACIQLPLTSFSSIQMALYRRDFDFKTLFLVRVIAIFIPFFVTIPLALYGFSYWALIIGLICGQLSNAVILTIKSKWKPGWFYSVAILKEMLSFSIWSLIEAISIWVTVWVDAFIIGSALNGHYLGLYKTSITMVNSLMALITASIIPVLFSTLSRLQNDSEQFKHVYFRTQRLVSFFVFPMGVGLYLYSDLATKILLGSQWSEASGVIGLRALTGAISIVFGYLCSEVYRARGKPKLSFLAQVLYLVVLVPVCIFSSKYGFWPFIYARSLVFIPGVLVDFTIMKFAMGFSVLKTLGNVFPTAISAAVMGLIGFYLRQLYDGVAWSFASIAICIAIYFGYLAIFPSMRKEMAGLVKGRGLSAEKL